MRNALDFSIRGERELLTGCTGKVEIKILRGKNITCTTECLIF
jgi:hypothetical protein